MTENAVTRTTRSVEIRKEKTIMNAIGERVCIGAAMTVAGLLAYLTFPALLNLIAPEAPPLWEPVVENNTAAVIVVGTTGFITGIWLFLAVTNRFRIAKVSDEPVIPVWVWVAILSLIYGVLATSIIVFIAMAAIGFLLDN